jgi:hypothetical protein
MAKQLDKTFEELQLRLYMALSSVMSGLTFLGQIASA